VLAVAVPVMISNVTVPLLGVVDTGVVGQIPDPAYIGAVALGSILFNFVFWAFGFLRMGTTGLTAQAFGAGDRDEVAASLGRALLIAAAVGAALIVLQWPIRETAFVLLGGSAELERLARDYFDIRIWAAPATLANYALLGWFIGLGRSAVGLVLQLVLNVTNIVLDVAFVLGFGWGVQGVALGTLIAEFAAAAVGIAIALRGVRAFGGHATLARLLDPEKLRRTLAVSADIMIRTLALTFSFAWFVAHGAAQGDVVLAANTVLANFISVAAYFLDGIAFAAETFVGRAIGAAQRAGLRIAVRLTTQWAAGIAVSITAVLLAFGPLFVDVLTVDPGVRAAARVYLRWAAFVPVLGVWAWQLDGIFIGATRTAEMRNASLATLAIFLAAWWALTPFGNHGLWAAFYVSYLARAGTLLYYYPALVRSVPVVGQGSG
jgi:multidrug resistance protein, MATE family